MLRALSISVLLALVAIAPVSAQDYPNRPIKILIPYAPGGPSDVAARAMGQKLEERLKQPIVVDNRPGANAVIAGNALLASPADGYTILMANAASLTSTFIKAPPFNSLKDFEPVSPILGASYAVLVNGDLPVKTLPELVAYAKANPGKLNGASPYASSLLFLELFRNMAGIDFARIDYKGSTPASTALLANEVQFVIDNPVPFRQHIAAGKMRVIATTASQRSPFMPDVPSAPEAGYPGLAGFSVSGFWAPLGTPKAAIAKFNAALNEVLKLPEIVERLAAIGCVPVTGSPEDLRALATREAAFYAEAARLAKYQPE